MSGKQVKLWRYYLPNESGIGGWAEIVIGSNGFFAAVSDFGNYSFAWRHHGCDDFREFLLRAPQNWDYMAHKLGGQHSDVYDQTATLRAIRGYLIESRRRDGLSKSDARREWDLLSEFNELYSDYDFSLWYQKTRLDDASEFRATRIDCQLEHFCKVTLARLGVLIRAELEAESTKGAA